MTSSDSSKVDRRRSISTRDTHFARSFARWLSTKNISPNQISIASVAFSLCSGICLFLRPMCEKDLFVLVGAAVFIQLRLLCNLFDGMVAIEGGKSTKSGELFNDMPDRIADPIILVAAGYSVGFSGVGPILGWLAGILAVMTAYVRVLSVSIGAPQSFIGPMAKQHRMAIITISCVLSIFESDGSLSGVSMTLSLSIIIIGCVVTIVRRVYQAYITIEVKGD